MRIVTRYQLDTIKSQFWEVQLTDNGNGTYTYWSCHRKRNSFIPIKEAEKLITKLQYEALKRKYEKFLIETLKN